jgi:hypothetical protein
VGSVPMQKAMVRVGLGTGILGDYALEPRDGLPSLPIQGARTRTLALCHLKAGKLGTPAQNLVRLLGLDD